MKSQLRFIVALIATSVMFFSCKKLDQENSQTATPNVFDPSVVLRPGEVLPDPPELKAKLKLEFSEELLREGKTIAFTKGGKKYYEGSHNQILLEAFSAAKGGTKGNGWGQGGSSGGSTGGSTGGGGTTTGDVTPPRVIIVSPNAGQLYDISLRDACEVIILVDDNIKPKRIVAKIRDEVIMDTTSTTFRSGVGGFNELRQYYFFPFGDGTYNLVVQAWDDAGNSTTSTILFSRNSQTAPITVNYPEAYTLPQPRDPYSYQGGEGSCAAFTVSNAYTIQRYVKERQTGGFNANNVYSPEWVYNLALRGQNCGAGSSVIGNMAIVADRGIPTWSALPYNYNNGCDTSMFTDAIRANALSNKIATWGTTVTTADINLIKQNVYLGKVGMFMFGMDHNFVGGGPDYIWTFPHYYDYYLHGCCVVGYDDSKHAFLVFNSWGDAWANNNCRWIDYDFFWQCVASNLYYFNM